MEVNLIIVVLSLCIVSCAQQLEKHSSKPKFIQAIDIPAITIDKADLQYNPKISLWTLDDQCFSGFAISRYPDGSLKQKFGVFEGRKQNQALDWFPDGHLHYLANYHKGKLQGEKKAWSMDSTHILISHLNYTSGKVHGVQKKWYATGEIFKILNLNMGKEEGVQRAFRKNGDLFANYEAREGRIFGLKRASLCFGLEDEIVQYKE
ncbi:MAG: toxin-antitoxin system YwqK family antitoxin [Bacteroidia bacterium]